MRTRYRRIQARRGHRWDAPLTSTVPPPDTTGTSWTVIARRVQRTGARRTRRSEPPRVGADAFYGLWKGSDIIRPSRRPPYMRRRGRILQVPLAALDIYFKPDVLRKRRLVPGLSKRPRRADPPWAQAAAPTAPAYPFAVARIRRPLAFRRRGRRADAPWPQAQAAAPPAYPFTLSRVRRASALLRRSRRSEPIMPQRYMPQAVQPRRRPVTAPRRRPLPAVIHAQRFPPALSSPRRRPAARPRRGKLLEVIFPGAVGVVVQVGVALVTAVDAFLTAVSGSDASGTDVSATDAQTTSVSASDASGTSVSAADSGTTTVTGSDADPTR